MKISKSSLDVRVGSAFGVRMIVPAAIALAITAASAFSADITGTITVKQRLTRPSVTASSSVYERGPGVELGKDAETDLLAAERERVVVYVEGPSRGDAVSKEAVASPGRPSPDPQSMKQTNRRFDPEIVVIPMGSAVVFPNMDPIFHNVFSLSKAQSFDLGNYPKGETRKVTFPKPGIVYVNCRLHPNMAGAIVVTPNQWYARVGRDGQFALHDLPAGTYTVVAWHKTTGFIRKQVQVEEGRDSIVNFLVPVTGPLAGTDADMSPIKMTLR
jgi:plastocyanin